MSPPLGTAHARVGLLGNPSDGFGGAVLGFAVGDFAARVHLSEDANATAWRDLAAPGAARTLAGTDKLTAAALAVFAEHFGSAILGEERRAFAVHTDIPRQVGLAGSSAVVTAALRALSAHSGRTLDPLALADLALRAETHHLGIAAGPQDRLLQAFQGFLWMDFRAPRAAHSYLPLDPALLPPTFLAWRRRPSGDSGAAHSDVRQRFDAGDVPLRTAIAEFARLAEAGLAALLARDRNTLRALIDRNFDLRASIWNLAPSDAALVHLGRRLGAAVKFTGSGGAVVGLPAAEADFPALEQAYRDADCGFCRPTLAPLRVE